MTVTCRITHDHVWRVCADTYVDVKCVVQCGREEKRRERRKEEKAIPNTIFFVIYVRLQPYIAILFTALRSYSQVHVI